MKSNRELTVLDCTFRDGGYYTGWVFERDLVNRYLSAISTAGIDVIEIGFRQPPNDRFLGPFAFSNDRYLSTLNVPEGLVLAVMSDAKVLLRAGEGYEIVDQLYGPRADSPVDIVRIAAGIAEVPKLAPAIGRLKEKGYTVCLNVMQIGNKPMEQIAELARTISSFQCDVLYFADSFGNMDPEMVRATVEALRLHWKEPLGIHTHDNMNLGLANSLAALDAGVSWVDGTILGMGRGAGNVAMEYLLHALQGRGYGRYRSDALLTLLLEDFMPLRQRHGWGPNFLYYLAALHEIHPTYLQRLQEPGQVDAEALANALDFLRGAPSNAFSEEALGRAMRAESVQVDGSWSATGWAEGRDVLLVAGGPGAQTHREAIIHFIRTHKPRVVSLNFVDALPPELVDAYAVCHPGRLVRDLPDHRDIDRPLILPLDAFAQAFAQSLGQERICNFGITIEPGAFATSPTQCTIPTRKVAPYALALAGAAGARNIFLAGFDGFEVSDPRHQEMNAIFDLFRQAFPETSVTALTPSTYNVAQSSIYAY